MNSIPRVKSIIQKYSNVHLLTCKHLSYSIRCKCKIHIYSLEKLQLIRDLCLLSIYSSPHVDDLNGIQQAQSCTICVIKLPKVTLSIPGATIRTILYPRGTKKLYMSTIYPYASIYHALSTLQSGENTSEVIYL